MKFGKSLETNAEAMPEEWRPYVIHYKALKKKINAIVQELDDRGLPSPIIKKLLSQSMSGDMHRMEYSFDEDKEHLRSCIKVVVDDLPEQVQFGPEPLTQDGRLSQLLAHELTFLNKSASSSTSDLTDQSIGTDADLDGHSGAPVDIMTRHEDMEAVDVLEAATTVSEVASEDTSLSEEDLAHVPRSRMGYIGSRTSSSSSLSLLAATAVATSDEDRVHESPIPSLIATAATMEFSDLPTVVVVASTDPDLSGQDCSTTHRPNPSLGAESTTTTFCALFDGPLIAPQCDASHDPASEATVNATAPLSSMPRASIASDDTSSVSSLHSFSTTTSQLKSDEEDEPIETVVTSGARNLMSHTVDHGPLNASSFHTTEEDGKRVLVIELTADTAFFDQLGEEVSQLSKLQQVNKQQFESKVEDLSKILTVVSSPSNKDMYTWREILKLYLDAQIFVGDQESDRSTRSSERAQKQLQWFLKEMDRSKLIYRLKMDKSKVAFNTFFQLNSDLITMKQFKELNQMAMTKILKKHDKRTSLTASLGFPKHLQNEPFYQDNISKALTYTIGCQLVSIIPQPDDYSCPICMSVAWKPIRLTCNHVFCVRCLIKAQRKRMRNCPICRETNTVLNADAGNLDVALMNFMKLYFPKEIKEKRKDSSREQAAEEMEAITGRRWTEQEGPCVIM